MSNEPSAFVEVMTTTTEAYLARVEDVLNAPRHFDFALRFYGSSSGTPPGRIRFEVTVKPQGAVAIAWIDRAGQIHRSSSETGIAGETIRQAMAAACLDAGGVGPERGPRSAATPSVLPTAGGRAKNPTRIGDTMRLF